MTKYIIAADKVREINVHDALSACENDDGTITIEYLEKCGNELVADCIERVYNDEHLRWVSSDEASSEATYQLCADIYEPCEGGIVVFDTLQERDTWLNQR